MYISELQFYYFKENICLQLFDSLWYCFFVIPQYLWKFHYFLASVFLLTSVKCPDKAQKLMVKEMQHEDTTQRINAVLRYMYNHVTLTSYHTLYVDMKETVRKCHESFEMEWFVLQVWGFMEI